MQGQANIRIGRPPRDDINMDAVLSLLPSLSIRKISKRLGVPCGTLSYRLRLGETFYGDNPFCVVDRVRMLRRKTRRRVVYYFCEICGQNTLPQRARRIKSHRKGRPPAEFDYTKASELLARLAVVEVAETLGVHRNTLYRHIGLGLLAGRSFRTWIPRQGWVPHHSRENFTLYWPYMTTNDPRYEGVIRKVNEAVPRSMDDAVRADVCQDILVSVLTGEIHESDIQRAVKLHVSRHYKLFPVRDYNTRSLDSVVPGTERKLIDTISADAVAARIADAWEANRLTTPMRRRAAHFDRPQAKSGLISVATEYDRYRRKYQIVKGRLLTHDDDDSKGFGVAWTTETALPEELREQNVFQSQTISNTGRRL